MQRFDQKLVSGSEHRPDYRVLVLFIGGTFIFTRCKPAFDRLELLAISE